MVDSSYRSRYGAIDALTDHRIPLLNIQVQSPAVAGDIDPATPLVPTRSRRTKRRPVWQCERDLLPLVLMLLSIIVIELVFAYVSVTHCLAPVPLVGDASGSEPVTSVMVLADLHVDSLCPMSDMRMTLTRIAGMYRHNANHLIVLGDVMSMGGGEDGTYNITGLLWEFHTTRVELITGCSPSAVHSDNARCIILPGNHDLVTGPTERWLQNYSPVNRLTQMGSLKLYVLNSQQPVLPLETRADFLLSHTPVNIGPGISLASTIPSVATNGSFIGGTLSAHIHVAGHNITTREIAVPSMNLVRYLSTMWDQGGCLTLPDCQPGRGFGVLRDYANGAKTYQLCLPGELSYLIHAMMTLTLVALAAKRGSLGSTLGCFFLLWLLVDLLLYFPPATVIRHLFFR